MGTATLLDIAMSHSDQIIERARLGDRGAFNQLVSLWYKRIYNFTNKYFNDHDLASEASQKTFIKVFDSLGQLSETTKFKSWIYVIALNYCREEDRKQGRVSQIFVQEKDEVKNRHEDKIRKGPGKQLESNELSEIVLAGLNELPDEQKTIVIMKEYEGLKFREIAEVLSISENTVKSRLYYGLKNMKKILENDRAFNESYDHGK
ncbi:MAG: RNA polymerase sigma factor [Reichenbachiella sp.]